MSEEEKHRNPAAQARGDELSGEFAIRATLEPTGLNFFVKSRALAAADRLIGGVLGILAAYVEDGRSRMEIRNSSHRELLREKGRQEVERLKDMGEAVRVAMQRSFVEEFRKQTNLEAIWIKAQDALLTTPSVSAEVEDKTTELDEDWINMFASYAEKASSERLQQLWGRILAGEIRKPCSFALSTLRIISEMDAEIAATFQDVVSHRFRDDALLTPVPLAGEQLIRWTFLEEIGLLQEINGNLAMNYEKNIDGHVWIQTQSYVLKVTMSENNRQISVPFVRITRAGQQIARILPWDELSALKEFASRSTMHLGSEIGRILERHPDGRSRAETIEINGPVASEQK